MYSFVRSIVGWLTDWLIALKDSEVTVSILRSGEQDGRFVFGSGYFNLTQEYRDHSFMKGTVSVISSDTDIRWQFQIHNNGGMRLRCQIELVGESAPDWDPY